MLSIWQFSISSHSFLAGDDSTLFTNFKGSFFQKPRSFFKFFRMSKIALMFCAHQEISINLQVLMVQVFFGCISYYDKLSHGYVSCQCQIFNVYSKESTIDTATIIMSFERYMYLMMIPRGNFSKYSYFIISLILCDFLGNMGDFTAEKYSKIPKEQFVPSTSFSHKKKHFET